MNDSGSGNPADAFSGGGFQDTIHSFTSQIREATDPVLQEILICDFSTTRREKRLEKIMFFGYHQEFSLGAAARASESP